MKILYITYDGLTDFIGQSQILPYLLGCALAGHRLTVISFEKPERLHILGKQVQDQCSDAGIEWLPQKFSSNPPYLAKVLDQQMMRRVAIQAAARSSFDYIHARSYPAAVTGLAVKKRFGAKLLFDMRGFWPDQRREGGRWTGTSPIGRYLYARWKAHEASLISAADHIVVLTHAARNEVQHWPAHHGAPISIIPCCTDFCHFATTSEPTRRLARQRLDLDDRAPILGYLGSMGTVYLLTEHLRLFDAIRRRDAHAKLLFLGRDEPDVILSHAARHGISLARNEIRAVHAERPDVPYWLSAADIGSCFIVPTYSSLGVSPTKLAEYLACGIPVIANSGVGDVESILAHVNGGHVLRDFSPESIEAGADAFFRLRSLDREALRDRARRSMDIPNAVAAYLDIYDNPADAVTVGSW